MRALVARCSISFVFCAVARTGGAYDAATEAVARFARASCCSPPGRRTGVGSFLAVARAGYGAVELARVDLRPEELSARALGISEVDRVSCVSSPTVWPAHGARRTRVLGT